jgi:soluble lytic murein transglycosylase-like protein
MNQRDVCQPLAVALAQAASLDPALICAMCHHESSWDPTAVRFEPAFFEKYIKPMVNPQGLIKGYPSTLEAEYRSTSIGLMQIMGQTAREQGFEDDLGNLKVPEKGIEQGCIKMSRCLKLALARGQGVEQALLYYNGGAAPEYPGLVLQFYDLYK